MKKWGHFSDYQNISLKFTNFTTVIKQVFTSVKDQGVIGLAVGQMGQKGDNLPVQCVNHIWSYVPMPGIKPRWEARKIIQTDKFS